MLLVLKLKPYDRVNGGFEDAYPLVLWLEPPIESALEVNIPPHCIFLSGSYKFLENSLKDEKSVQD